MAPFWIFGPRCKEKEPAWPCYVPGARLHCHPALQLLEEPPFYR